MLYAFKKKRLQPYRDLGIVLNLQQVSSRAMIQCSPFMFGSIAMDPVICELCYTETILQRNYRKMTILWSFSYNSFVKKIHG